MKQIKDILKFLFRIIVEPEETWQKLSERDQDRNAVDAMQHALYFPLLGAGALLLFLAGGWRVSPFGLEPAMKGGVSFLLSYFAGYYLAVFCISEFFKSTDKLVFDKYRLYGFTAYAMSFTLIVEIWVGCFPSMKFFTFICLYVTYIIWCGSRYYLFVDERRRLRFSIFASLFIYFAPWVIGRLLHLMEHMHQYLPK